MSFRVAQKTLKSLEWPRIVERLHATCRTPGARKSLSKVIAQPEDDDQTEAEEQPADSFEFAQSLARVHELLAETTEARALLDRDEVLPVGDVSDLETAFRRASKGGVMRPRQLLEVRNTLQALHETSQFLARHTDDCPRLAELAATLSDHHPLERNIDWSIDLGGEVRDEASRELAAARRESRQLAGDLQHRLAGYLQDPNVSTSLSDDFYTVRNDRYVLPVRADHRGQVQGIVHDASRSGTTLFIEPTAVVDLNNRLKQAELAVAREIQRVLRELTTQVALALPLLRADIETLAVIDLAFARGHLSCEMQAVAPTVEHDGIFSLHQLRHPLLPPDEAVPNDIHLGDGWHVLVISGPNAGGKTVALKSLGLAALFVRAGLHVPAAPGGRVALVDSILADIGDGQDMRESLSTFSAHMVGLAEIVESASPHSLALLDEVGVGTDPGEGAALAQAVLETLADAGTRVIATTHYNLLKEMADVDERFCNASVEFDPETLAPTFRLHVGTPGVSSATSVAARMGMPSRVLDRANALLDREDRQLDRMLSELGANRAALEAEQREMESLRAESEAMRDEYRAKLERLQERRDKLFFAMRADLDAAFKDAHEQVGSVIRDLQRGNTAQEAGRARTRLQDLEAKSEEAAQKAGVQPEAGERHAALDWRKVRVGDEVGVPNGGIGVLAALPDRRGRVRVAVGSATIVLLAERVGRPPADRSAQRQKPQKRVRVDVHDDTEGGLAAGGTSHCDLRGLRVDEALERVADSIDRAISADRAALEFIHGIGTGALRRAVRAELAESPYVTDVRSGDPDHGGEGVTHATLSPPK